MSKSTAIDSATLPSMVSVPRLVCNTLIHCANDVTEPPYRVSSISTTRISNTDDTRVVSSRSTTQASSLSTFMGEHDITWISFNPGVSTMCIHLQSALHSRLNLIVIEQNECCLTINESLLHDATLIHGDWATMMALFPAHTESFHIDKQTVHLCTDTMQPSSSLSVNTLVRGIDFHFDDKIELPLPKDLPSSMCQLIDCVNRTNARSLQFLWLYGPYLLKTEKHATLTWKPCNNVWSIGLLRASSFTLQTMATVWPHLDSSSSGTNAIVVMF